MPIYTKTGDKGKTALRTNERVWKDSVRVESYGTVDELNAYLGVVLSYIDTDAKKELRYVADLVVTVQNDLFFIGSYIANPGEKRDLTVLNKHITYFEDEIDGMTEQMPELKNFILPGGGKVGASLQYARTISRRAERKLVSLHKAEGVEKEILQYINRLSDLLFTLSRFANYVEKKKEIIWSL